MEGSGFSLGPEAAEGVHRAEYGWTRLDMPIAQNPILHPKP